MEQFAINMRKICMSFSGVTVLKNVDFALKVGEVKGLLGKNGAGKSTLLKIIQGLHTPTEGNIEILGKEISRSSSMAERSQIVSMIFQDFSLIPEMTVVENIFFNGEPRKGLLINDKLCHSKVQEFFAKYNINIDPNQKIKNLSTSEMQMVEICKSIIRNKKIILMDEPTAALDAEQTEKLFAIIQKMKLEGISIVLITHHLKEIIRMCDSVAVLRDGNLVLSDSLSQVGLPEIISAMLGEETNAVRMQRTKTIINKEQPVLEVKNIISTHRKKPMSFKLYPGEVVGLAGLKGSGRTELFNSLFGVDPIVAGEILLNGKSVKINSPEDAVKNGFFLVPENRQTLGLSLNHNLYFNMHLPWMHKIKSFLFLDDKKGKDITNGFVSKLSIKTDSIFTVVKNLSGGNQQKVVIGKALATEPKVLLMDDPTYGVDIHAKSEIMKIIDEFRSSGGAVLMVSSDLEEIVYNCDRVITMNSHEITGEINEDTNGGITQENITTAIQ